jgi:phosphomevalonate kinase
VTSTSAGPAGNGPVVSVPGKLFLGGEYAVLEGAPAIVAAVNRRARATFVPGSAPSSAVIAAAMVEVRQRVADLPPGAAQVDTSRFMREGVKLGLGSSAAAAVAAVAAAFEHGGVAIADHRDLVLASADAAHRAAQGGLGSGADIAAAVHGGFLRFVRHAAGASDIQSVTVAPDLRLLTFWTRAAARTVDFISGVRRFAQANPSAHARRLADLHTLAGRFAHAFVSDARQTVEHAAAYGDALAALGLDAALPIVPPAVAEAMALARSLGGAAKPSGAGGGDMGVGFFAGKDAADAFAARCPQGVLVLDIAFGADGAHRVAPGD